MKLLLPFALLLAVVLGCNTKTSTPTSETGIFAPANQATLWKRIDGLFTLKPKWQTVSISKLEKNSITVYLNYKRPPASMSEVKTDTDSIAQTILNDLVKQGYKPRDEWLALHVHAQMPESGATGSAMVRRYGKTEYDFNNDSLVFEAVK